MSEEIVDRGRTAWRPRKFWTDWLVIGFVALTTACDSTVITSAGPDTYVVVAPFASFSHQGSVVEFAAINAADAFCAPHGLRALIPPPLPRHLQQARSANLGYSLPFQCFPPDHPAYARFRQDYLGIVGSELGSELQLSQ